jgi:hypothetical protein
MFYASGAGALAVLGAPVSGAMLVAVAGLPAWLAPGTNGHLLTMVAGAPAWTAAPAAPPTDPVAGTGGLRTLGTGAQQAAAGNHSHAVDASAGTGSLRTLGTGAQQAAAGNHTHSSGAPSAHAVTHAPGGSDQLGSNSVNGTMLAGASVGPSHIQSGGNWLFTNLRSEGIGIFPADDNARVCGAFDKRWTTVYATTGTINTSSRAAKRLIRPLEPARALDVARATRIHTFNYRTADPALRRMRHVGFIAEDTDRLLTLDGRSASPQSTASLAIAAIQELDRRLARLEGAAA